MKKFNLALLTLAISLSLTACSSSSNDGKSEMDENKPTVQVEAKKPANSKDAFGQVLSLKYNKKEASGSDPKYDLNAKAYINKDTNTITITVDGKEVKIGKAKGFDFTYFTHEKSDIDANTQLGKFYVFGEITPESAMKSQKGDKVIYKQDNSQYYEVNFDQKELKGFKIEELEDKTEKSEQIAFAKITGNKFSGEFAQPDLNMGDVTLSMTSFTRGQFNGPNAEEMSGSIEAKATVKAIKETAEGAEAEDNKDKNTYTVGQELYSISRILAKRQ